jgi:GABA(A) receptor-associated protein
MSIPYKIEYSFQDRVYQTQSILEKYPDRVPVICEKNQKSLTTRNIDKRKYLVPFDLTVGQFMYVIRKRLQLPAEYGLYFFIKGYIPPSSVIISEIYDKYKDEDGFLYIVYSMENTFGLLYNK